MRNPELLQLLSLLLFTVAPSGIPGSHITGFLPVEKFPFLPSSSQSPLHDVRVYASSSRFIPRIGSPFIDVALVEEGGQHKTAITLRGV